MDDVAEETGGLVYILSMWEAGLRKWARDESGSR